MPLVQLFFDVQNKQLVRGFNNTIQAGFPNCFQGDTLTLQMRFMNPTGNQQVPYVDVDESAAFVQVAIGTIAGLPLAGTFTITDTLATQTTAAIPFNASASTVQSAIVAALTTNWSTATVTGSTGGPWRITNGVNGAQSALLVIGTAALSPASQAQIEQEEVGTGSTPAIQWFKLQLSPVAYQDSWTAFPAPAVAISNIQTGGVSGSNSIQGITLNNQPYTGTFTVTFGGQTTAPLSYNSTTAQVQTALQALSSIGSGNVSVGGIIGSYIVTFIGSLGGAAQAAFTASAAGLTGPLMLTGTLSLATVGIEEAVGEAQSIQQTFEVNITPSGGAPQTVLQTSVVIGNDLIPNAPTTPTPTATYLLSGNNLGDVASLSQSLKNLWVSIGTTLGDLIYSAASGVATRLAGNTTATKKFLTQTGTGSASTAPGWNTIAAGDLPLATTGAFGAVKPDGSSIAISGGVISATGGAIVWTIKTANYTLVAGNHIAADSTSGIFSLTLPSATGGGVEIDILDPQASWATNNVTVLGTVNGSTNLILNIAGATVRLVDVGGSAGWRAN